MFVPLSWLKEHIGVDDDAAAIDRKLTMLGLEVEGTEEKSGEPVFDIKLTANKSDSLSIYGIARELALVANAELKHPAPSVDRFAKSSLKPAIEIQDADLCPRYSGLIIEGVTVKPSPQKTARRLEQCGIRPINDAVDATNYVLLELGQPLHAFDLDLLDGRKIIVRRAAEKEPIKTLDGVARTLTPDNLVIADATKAVALAGVMGGSNSEINPATRNILLESAYFDPVSVRRTGRKLGLHSEASHRFERGADYEGTVRALLRCAELILEQNPGAKVSAVTDVYPKPIIRKKIVFRSSRYTTIAGVTVPFKDAVSIIRKTGCSVVSEDVSRQSIEAVPPSWRPDLEREIDLIEEVARVTGYDKIPVLLPEVTPVTSELFDRFNLEFEILRHLRAVLAGNGLNEAVNYSFESAEFNDKLGLPADGRILVQNPLDQNQGMMRVSLVPGLLTSLQRNCRFLNHDLGLFEIGNVFRKENTESLQENRLAVLLSGLKLEKRAHQKEKEWDWFDLKGLVEHILSGFALGTGGYRPSPRPEPFLHKGRNAEIIINGNRAGFLGQLGYATCRQLDLKGPVFIAELSVSPLINAGFRTKKYVSLEKLLPVRRDVSLLVPRTIANATVIDLIKGTPLVSEVVLTDLYEDEKIGRTNVGMTFSVKLAQSGDKPLSDADISARTAELVKGLEDKLGLKQR